MNLDNQEKEFGRNTHSKRSAILDGARKVFLTRGFDGSSMSEIARVAGVSKGTLYVYYADKNKLFESIIDEEIRRHAEIDFQFDPQHQPEGVLREFGRCYVRAICQRGLGLTIRTVMAIAEQMPEVGRHYYEQVIGRTARRLGHYLNAQVAVGHLVQLDGDFAASQFVLMCQASLFQPFIFHARPAPSETEISMVVDSATRLFLAAYATETGPTPIDEGERPSMPAFQRCSRLSHSHDI